MIEVRGRAMAGVTRLHEPSPGDPLHVLVIDELAALLAYADPDTRREASRQLSEVLTQRRALGIVVIACVQDPRKETVGMRGLFTQTIALRLRSSEETRMVLGDGMAALAPAHRLSPDAPGSAWVVEDDGHADRVRADYWTDQQIRRTAAAYPAPVAADPGPAQAADRADAPVGPQDAPGSDKPGPGPRAGTVTEMPTRSPSRPRQPRAPRATRTPRTPRVPDAPGVPEHAEPEGGSQAQQSEDGRDGSRGGWVA